MGTAEAIQQVIYYNDLQSNQVCRLIIYGIGRPKILDTKIQIIIRYDLTSVIHPNHVGLLRKEQNPKTSHK